MEAKITFNSDDVRNLCQARANELITPPSGMEWVVSPIYAYVECNLLQIAVHGSHSEFAPTPIAGIPMAVAADEDVPF